MAISASLIAKGITGTLALAAPVATSVYYKDSIYELFVSKETNQDKGSQNPDSAKSNPEDGSWNIGEEEGKIKITYPESKSCSLTVTNSGSATTGNNSVIGKLKGKLGEENATIEDQKRYRKGLIEKCKNNELSLNVSDENNINLSSLFDLSKVDLSKKEKENLSTRQFTFSSSVNTDKLTVTVSVNYATNDDSSVKECKIIGSKKDSDNIDESKLSSSNDSIKTSVETAVNANKEGFLINCKRSYNNEIELFLNKKSDDSYELENLSTKFQITTAQ